MEIRAQTPAFAEEGLAARKQGREGARPAPAHRGLPGVSREDLDAEEQEPQGEEGDSGQQWLDPSARAAAGEGDRRRSGEEEEHAHVDVADPQGEGEQGNRRGQEERAGPDPRLPVGLSGEGDPPGEAGKGRHQGEEGQRDVAPALGGHLAELRIPRTQVEDEARAEHQQERAGGDEAPRQHAPHARLD
jgi:hypothetical protein